MAKRRYHKEKSDPQQKKRSPSPMTDGYTDEVLGVSDRAAAIVIQSTIEATLRELILIYFGFESPASKHLLGGEDTGGELTFTNQVRLAYFP
jgi:hypothetical protein